MAAVRSNGFINYFGTQRVGMPLVGRGAKVQAETVAAEGEGGGERGGRGEGKVDGRGATANDATGGTGAALTWEVGRCMAAQDWTGAVDILVGRGDGDAEHRDLRLAREVNVGANERRTIRNRTLQTDPRACYPPPTAQSTLLNPPRRQLVCLPSTLHKPRHASTHTNAPTYIGL